MTPRGHIAEYRQNRVAGADAMDNPHRTVMLLLQGAIEETRRAENALAEKDLPGKVDCIDRALDIVDVLRAGLDHQAGGQIAGGLEALYVYIGECLVQANAGNRVEPLQEAIRLLSEIASAWAAIPPEKRQTTATP